MLLIELPLVDFLTYIQFFVSFAIIVITLDRTADVLNTPISDLPDRKTVLVKKYAGDIKLQENNWDNSTIFLEDKHGYLSESDSIPDLVDGDYHTVLKYIPNSQDEYIKVKKMQGTAYVHYLIWKDVPVKITSNKVILYVHTGEK